MDIDMIKDNEIEDLKQEISVLKETIEQLKRQISANLSSYSEVRHSDYPPLAWYR